jgi:lipopolysaccharide assembly outer membrane protein LptD (OstA)
VKQLSAPLVALLWAISCTLLLAQEPEAPVPFVSAADSLADSLLIAPQSEEGVDTTISYFAQHIYFDVNRRVTELTGNAAIEYKEMRLTAGRIEVDWEGQLLTALPRPDTLYLDSARTELDTIMWVEYPRFQQGRDDFSGDEITYNLESKVGRVKGGHTQYMDGEYYGEQFKRIDDNVITVLNGDFTTCDADTPHYHFSSKKLKIIVGKRVIARPLVLHFNKVPVFAAPYGVFPSQSGRASGIIIPTFGESAAQGRFLRNVGYYWAPSQYVDLLTTIDYFEKFGVLGRSTLRYAKRYTLSGTTNYYFDTQRQGTTKKRDYRISSTHRHTIDPNTQLSVNASYVSNKRFNDDVGSVQDLLNQSIRSDATLSKSWDNSPWSLSANVGFTQNIEAETWSAGLPRIRLSHRTGDLFPAPKAPRNLRGAVARKEARTPWYRAFKWSYNTNYANDYNFPMRPREIGLRLDPIGIDGSQGSPAVIKDEDSTHVFKKDGLAHRGSFSANARIFRYLNLNPTLNWDSDWVRRVVKYEAGDRVLDRRDEEGFFTRTTFSLGSSANTKLYGLARRPFGIGASFRHVMTPTVSFSYRPDFSEEKWGYYETATLPDGRSYTYDRFEGSEMASNIGGTPKGLSETFSFSLAHLFQMKTGSEEQENERKFDLLNANMSTRVNMKADSLKWSDLRMSFRSGIPGRLIGPFESLSFDISTTHSLYQSGVGGRINSFYWERDDAAWYSPLELTRMGATLGINLRAKTIGSIFDFGRREEVQETDSLLLQMQEELGLDAVPFDPGLTSGTLPSNLPPSPQQRQGVEDDGPSQFYQMPIDMQFTVHRTQNFADGGTTTNTLRSNMRLSLTPRWSTSVTYVLDLEDRLPDNASVNITRDLHCWEASFRWSPLGFSPGYFLRIGLKSPQLKDVKIERHRGGNFGGIF